MEYIRRNMSGKHRNRFAPGPMIISLGMGLLAPTVAGIIEQVLEGREHGPFGGMTGVQARVKGALFPDDTSMWKVRRGYGHRVLVATRPWTCATA
jgi:hypothetical protein